MKIEKLIVTTLCATSFAVSVVAQIDTDNGSRRPVSAHENVLDHQQGRVGFKDVKDGVMLVRTDKGAGSGFLLRQDGKKYLVTNLHVIKDATRVAAYFYGGARIPLGQLFIDEVNDLARFEVETDLPGFASCDDEPTIGDEISIYGDSQGAGVLTEIKGHIIGVGPRDLEIDAPIVQGNSGSALLNGKLEVLGVATYATREQTEWNADTRFGKVRRFAVRLGCARWQQSSIKELIKKREDDEKAAYLAEIMPLKKNEIVKATIAVNGVIKTKPGGGHKKDGKGGTVGTIKVKVENSIGRPFLLVSYIIDPKRYDRNNPKSREGFELRTFLYDFEKGHCVDCDGTRTIAAEHGRHASAERISMQGGKTLTEYVVGFQQDYILFPFEACYYRLEVWCDGDVVASKEGSCNNAAKPMRLPSDWFVASHNTMSNPMHRLGFAKVTFGNGEWHEGWPERFSNSWR